MRAYNRLLQGVSLPFAVEGPNLGRQTPLTPLIFVTSELLENLIAEEHFRRTCGRSEP